MKLVATFEDWEALLDAVSDRGQEGVVAKRRRDPYRPGETFLGENEEPRDGPVR